MKKLLTAARKLHYRWLLANTSPHSSARHLERLHQYWEEFDRLAWEKETPQMHRVASLIETACNKGSISDSDEDDPHLAVIFIQQYQHLVKIQRGEVALHPEE